MAGHNEEMSLSNYFEEWMGQQRYYLSLLLASLNHSHSENDLQELVARVLGHYQEYYEMKSRAARVDVFSLFSPPWFSTYERAYLWITGFKPGLAFQLVDKAVQDLSNEQKERFRQLKAETTRKERDLTNDLAKVQESMAAANVVMLTRELGRQLDGATEDVNEVLETLRDGMQVLVQSADYLRMSTAREVLDILNPAQSVNFLIIAAQFQIKLRVLGKHRDMQRNQGLG